MLDLMGNIWYNLITSERFFFFAIEPICLVFYVYCMLLFVLPQYVVKWYIYITKPREAFTFTIVRVKAKNISVKREVPL